MTPIQHSISLEEAIELTSRFQANRPADMPICETFEKDSVRKMLQAHGADKLRIYYGEKEDGSVCAVLVAADAEGNDMLPGVNRNNKNEEDDPDEYILENSYKCPPACPPESPLNNN
ncbi:hypothetical protein GWC95_15465 [Sediminibacterium roseum]|uniref:Uncharacterized protein n=1 Tax=Sediminibacterium roseum TaxID=1978412 RepID=A0ABW9ZW18_9BACT|nr:hypothetical protein [Sediminibacterium roseum]NCI51326.1 hypothetical protein [Sediminibacterium roseum]